MLHPVEPCVAAAGGEPSRTYYEVLGISPKEQDPKVIEEAALRCSAHVRTYQLTRESECTLLLNEIAQALITLLDPVRRRDYDLSLGKPPERRPARRDTPEGTLLLVIGDGADCDVKVVYQGCAGRKTGG